MHNMIMGNNPFVNGKHHPWQKKITWDNTHAMKTIQQNMDAVLKKYGITNKKRLSLAAGLGETYVSDIVKNRVVSPTIDKLRKVSKAIGCDIREIIDETELGGETPAIIHTVAPSQTNANLEVFKVFINAIGYRNKAFSKDLEVAIGNRLRALGKTGNQSESIEALGQLLVALHTELHLSDSPALQKSSRPAVD